MKPGEIAAVVITNYFGLTRTADAAWREIDRVIRAAILEEREACADIADADPYHTQSAEEIATLIRSRT